MRAGGYVTIAGDVTFTAAEGGHHTIVAKHYLHNLGCWQKRHTHKKLVRGREKLGGCVLFKVKQMRKNIFGKKVWILGVYVEYFMKL